MEMVPLSVGRAARGWDEQHLDLTAAADQVGSAPTSGFTSGVAGSASRFASTWQRHTAALADEAEGHADGLRSTIADFLRTDQSVGVHLQALQSYLVEHR